MKDSPITISITPGSIITAVAVLTGAWLLWFLRDLVLVLLTAIVIASAFEPAIKYLRRHKIPRILAVVILYLVLIGSFLGVFIFFVPSVLEDFGRFLTGLPRYIETFNQVGAFDHYSRILGIQPHDLTVQEVTTQIRETFNLGGAYSNALTAVSGIFGGVASFLLILIFSFYFAVLETGVDDFLRVVSPAKYQSYIAGLWKRAQHKIGLWMQGQMLLAVIMGVLVYLGLTILGVRHALLLAMLAAFFELIPVFGPVLAAVPAIIIGFSDGGVSLGLMVIGLYVIFQQFENHLIYPLVVTRVVGVPPLLVILALIIGAKLAGFLGILLSVPIAAALQELVKDIEESKVAHRPHTE